MLHCKSSLKAVLCSWHLTLSEPKQQTKKLSSAKTFPKRRAVSAGAVKAPGRGSASRLGSGDPCALLAATANAGSHGHNPIQGTQLCRDGV